MQSRFDGAKVAPGGYHAMLGLETYLHQSGLELPLLHLIRLRTSQINGCAYCIDLHWKDLRTIGENEQRLYGLDAWKQTDRMVNSSPTKRHGQRPEFILSEAEGHPHNFACTGVPSRPVFA